MQRSATFDDQVDPRSADSLAAELCCAMRLVHMRGVASANIAGHFSARLGADRLLVNRFGVSFASVEPRDLVVLDERGEIVEGAGRVNQTIQLHRHIHQRNPSLTAAVHSHVDPVITFSALRRPLEFFDQESCILVDAVAILDEDHGELDTRSAVADAFAADSRIRAVIAPNHGAFACGASIAEATLYLIMLAEACRRNLDVRRAAHHAGVEPRAIPIAAARHLQSQLRGLEGLDLLWEDSMRRLAETAPGLVALRGSGSCES